MPSPVPGPSAAFAPLPSSSGPIVFSAVAGNTGNAWPTAMKSLITSARLAQRCRYVALVAHHAAVRQLAATIGNGTGDGNATSRQILGSNVAQIALYQRRRRIELGARVVAPIGKRKRRVCEREARVRSTDVADEHPARHRGRIRNACSSVSWRTNISSVSTQSEKPKRRALTVLTTVSGGDRP